MYHRAQFGLVWGNSRPPQLNAAPMTRPIEPASRADPKGAEPGLPEGGVRMALPSGPSEEAPDQALVTASGTGQLVATA
jgi:hypothetical protein